VSTSIVTRGFSWASRGQTHNNRHKRVSPGQHYSVKVYAGDGWLLTRGLSPSEERMKHFSSRTSNPFRRGVCDIEPDRP
jgi:hypothetical protein